MGNRWASRKNGIQHAYLLQSTENVGEIEVTYCV